MAIVTALTRIGTDVSITPLIRFLRDLDIALLKFVPAPAPDDFDALLVSGNSFAGTPAKAGFPSVTVPGGFVPATDPVINPFPSGVTFSGPAYSEPTLIGLAYAFEQATHYRVPPASTPPLATDVVRRP